MLRIVAFLLLTTAAVQASAVQWIQLATGLEIASLRTMKPSIVGDSMVTVVRFDPEDWELVLLAQSDTDDATNRTAREWAEAHDLVVATNAGMFATDYLTHVGYMESGDSVNSPIINHYQSVAAFGPRPSSARPPFRIFDLDEAGVSIESIREGYGTLVQNLRLVKRPGENRWEQQDKMWSEAALGEDESGRVLFVFSRSPFSMHDLVEELLSAEIGLVALQHLEGGPAAQLYVSEGDYTLDLFGSFETTYFEDDSNDIAWPIPNVLGVRAVTNR